MHAPGAAFDESASTLVEWVLTPRAGGGTIFDLRESDFKTEAHLKENTGGWKHELGERTWGLTRS